MLTQERLKEVLNYDSETGEFHWKISGRGGPKPGSRAGSINGERYRQVRIDGKIYSSHRLAWLYTYGYFPENQIDHINRTRDDNRIENLREVSSSCNMRNRKGNSDSFSGVKGVYKNGSNWRALIRVDNKCINLGTFTTLFAAAKARAEAEEKHGFITCDRLSEAKIFANSIQAAEAACNPIA